MKKSAFFKESKIDLEQIICDALAELESIRTSDRTQSAKTQAEKRLGAKIKTAIFTDGRKKDPSKKITLTTFNKYLTKVRRAITAGAFKHHSLDKKLEGFATKLPNMAERFEAIGGMICSQAQAELKIIAGELNALGGAANKKIAQDIIKTPVVPETIKHLALTELEKTELAEKKERAIVAKQSALISINARAVNDLTARLLMSDRAHDLALGVALATGRRQYEILHLSTFTQAGGGKIQVQGLAKKGKKVTDSIVVIEPLAEAGLVLGAIERLRASEAVGRLNDAMAVDSTFYTKEERFNHAVRDFTRAAAVIFGEALGTKAGSEPTRFNVTGWTFKDSRAIFARMSYALYEAKAARAGAAIMDDALFFTQVLGHSDAEAQRSYRAFRVVGDVCAVDAADVERVKAADANEQGKSSNKRIRKLKGLRGEAAAAGVDDLFTKLIDWLSAEGNQGAKITTLLLRANIGGKNERLSVVMKIIKEHELQHPAEPTRVKRLIKQVAGK